MSIQFRLIQRDEIDVKVSQKFEQGVALALYKDARVDQNILDESVGNNRWQRRQRVEGNYVFCNIAIWDEELGQWVEKEDVGDFTGGSTERTKSIVSDSFKRAAFCWGIGRELYTAPVIFFDSTELKNFNDNGWCVDRFKVTDIQYDEKGNITSVNVYNKDTKIEKRFTQHSREVIKSPVQTGTVPTAPTAPARPQQIAQTDPQTQAPAQQQATQTQQTAPQTQATGTDGAPVERYLPFQ